MHDAIAAEKQGVPAIGVMTERFAGAARLMAQVLGLPDYPFVAIGHPISSATDEALAAYARATVERARALLLKP